MLQKLEDVERRYADLEHRLVDPEVIANRKEYARLGKERAEIESLVSCYRQWKKLGEPMPSFYAPKKKPRAKKAAVVQA